MATPATHASSDLYIGLMSGTSLDAIDVVLASCREGSLPELIHAITHPIPPEVRTAIRELCTPGHDEINRMGELDRSLGELFAEGVASLLAGTPYKAGQIAAIGSHGQTVRHHPLRQYGFSWQIGDPNTIALRTGITTVADFRRMDIAAGGHGAPLVPAFHQAMWQDEYENRVIVNIGGMANITALPARCNQTGTLCVTGFDTGPGNVLMDAWIDRHIGAPWDQHGAWAAQGEPLAHLLERWLAHPHITAPAPKSTGREVFNLDWLLDSLVEIASSPADIQRTLLEFTAQSISLSIVSLGYPVQRVLVCGGGSHNQLLMQRLSALIPDSHVATTASMGLDPDWVEAMAFAWLASQRILHLPGNVPAVTGAASPCILGGVFLPPSHGQISN